MKITGITVDVVSEPKLAALRNTIYVESSLLPADGRVELVDGCYPLPLDPGLSSWH